MGATEYCAIIMGAATTGAGTGAGFGAASGTCVMPGLGTVAGTSGGALIGGTLGLIAGTTAVIVHAVSKWQVRERSTFTGCIPIPYRNGNYTKIMGATEYCAIILGAATTGAGTGAGFGAATGTCVLPGLGTVAGTSGGALIGGTLGLIAGSTAVIVHAVSKWQVVCSSSILGKAVFFYECLP